MTNAEKATIRINKAVRKLTFFSDQTETPATHLISGCYWSDAIIQINESINKLNEARALLAPLAENRPR